MLDFCQDGYDERSEFIEFNKVAWGEVLQKLKRVVESQTSKPAAGADSLAAKRRT